jgi:hypothetical protein
MAEIVEIMDFAADDVEITFRVGADQFFCAPDIPLGIMQKIVGLKDIQKTIEEAGSMEPILVVFDQFLTSESAVLFRACVENKKTIGLRRIMRILPWIMEKYGLRPTQPSSPSLDGLNDGESGFSSTAGVSPLGIATSPVSEPQMHSA